jgi:hypothetical protein
MASALGHAVVTIAVNAAAFEAGLVGARRALHGFVTLAKVLAFEVAASFVGAAGAMADTVRNIEQTFGKHTKIVEESADRQAKAFGRSKNEFLKYAESVGRQLQNLGFNEKFSADMAVKMAEAVGRLAASRRISFGEATKEVEGGSELFSEDRVRAWAYEQKLIGARNQMLDEGAMKLLRYELALETIANRTANISEADKSWNNQVEMLQGNLANLAVAIGNEILPTMIEFLDVSNRGIEFMIENAKTLGDVFNAIASPLRNILELFGLLGPQFEASRVNPTTGTDRGAISARNDAEAQRARRERIVGSVMGGGGGGGGGAGFQGGLAEFAKKVQESAFSNRQIGLMEEQNKKAQMIVENTQVVANAWKEASRRAAMNPSPIPF